MNCNSKCHPYITKIGRTHCFWHTDAKGFFCLLELSVLNKGNNTALLDKLPGFYFNFQWTNSCRI